MPSHVIAFSAEQITAATFEIGKLRKSLQGRKLEEDDWTKIYCKVKGAPNQGWSNLPFRDYIHDGLGIEFKLLMKDNPSRCIGRELMHPAATRRISFDAGDSADVAAAKVIGQWGASIQEFENRVRQTSKTGKSDIRWGVLLWARDLSEVLYFEETLTIPSPSDYVGEWHVGNHRGNATRNLRIYEKATGRLAYSCTGEASGRKLQPYFLVPDVAHGAHIFTPEASDTIPIFVERKQADRFQKLFPDDHDAGFERLLDSWERGLRRPSR